jgi:hypothetical protein
LKSKPTRSPRLENEEERKRGREEERKRGRKEERKKRKEKQ